MIYIFEDKDGTKRAIPVKVLKADDYRAFYSHAITGGFVANYHFRIDFSQDEAPPVEFTEVEGKVAGTPEGVITRLVQASVFLSLPALKELSEFLARHVKEHEDKYGQIQKPISLSGPFKTGDAPANEEKKDGK